MKFKNSVEGFVYKIVNCLDADENAIFVGYTFDIGECWSKHKKLSVNGSGELYKYMRSRGGVDNFTMKLLRSGMFVDENELVQTRDKFVVKVAPLFEPPPSPKPRTQKRKRAIQKKKPVKPTRVTCECGINILRTSLARHCQTAKHKAAIQIQALRKKIERLEVSDPMDL